MAGAVKLTPLRALEESDPEEPAEEDNSVPDLCSGRLLHVGGGSEQRAPPPLLRARAARESPRDASDTSDPRAPFRCASVLRLT